MLSLSTTRRVFAVLISALFIALLFEPGQYSQAQTGNTIATVSGAHYEAPVAPDSIASLFGTNLATGTASAVTSPLPTTLEGTTVTVEDSLGFQRTAGLYFVSPGQLNILIPAATATGPATIKVVAGNGAMSSGTVTIVQASPSIFAANSDGKGVPAADLVRVKPGNVQIFEALIQGSYPNLVPRPIDMGAESDVMFLILYLTGLRGVPSTDGIAGNGSAENVVVILGGVEIAPSYAGIAPGFFGLDQLNVPIPRSLIGRGKVNVSVTAPGFGTSNEVEIDIASPAGAQPPLVTGINGPSSLLARDQLALNGTNLPSVPGDSLVRIGGIEAGVESATPSQLLVRVPFGVVTGPVTLATGGGSWSSGGTVPVRTSISGFVRDTNEQPLAGAKVSLVGNPNFVTTPLEGWFVLPDTPTGAAIAFKVEVPNQGPLPYPNPPLKLPVASQRDNQYPGTIYLQQASGPSIQFGGNTAGSGQGVADGSEATTSLRASVMQQVPPETSISTGGITFRLPVGARAEFPDNSNSGRITLDVLTGSLTPAKMPRGIFSQSVAQLAPLGVTFNPGGRLIFPNLDGYAPDSSVMLFKYDLNEGAFIDTGIKATVSADGSTISTPLGSITETSYYFVAAPRPVTALTGRVLDFGGTNPVRGAVVRARGQETKTDGNGAYVLRNVPAIAGTPVPVTASLLRFTGRVDRISGESQAAIINDLTKVNDLVLPSATANRPPLVFSPTSVEAYENALLELNVKTLDIDEGQRVTLVTLTGANFVQLIPQGTGDHLLRISPPPGAQGNYQLSILATDSMGATTERLFSVIVKRRPTASNQSVNVIEDGVAGINLLASDVDNKPLVFTITRGPSRGTLTGRAPALTYRPNANFSGTDSFSFKVSNGFTESAEATVQIHVISINDPPVLVVPGPQTTAPFTPLQFTVSATDIDGGQSVVLSAHGLPQGAEFDPATGVFRWQEPSPSQIGSHVVTFTATDTGVPPISDSKTVTITVGRGTGAWVTTKGPNGGTVNAFVQSGKETLAGTEDSGVFRSVDNGDTWVPVNEGLGSVSVRALILFREVVYAATSGGVYRLNGDKWSAVNEGLKTLSSHALVVAFGTLFVGTEGGVFRLNQNGTAWLDASGGLQNLDVRALAASGIQLFAGTRGGGVFISLDVVGKWVPFSEGLKNLQVTSLAIRQGFPGFTIFAGTDGGGVYAAEFLQILEPWKEMNKGLHRLNVVALDLANGLLFAGTDNAGVFRFEPKTSEWLSVNVGLANPFIRSILGEGATIFAGSVEGGIFRSMNSGESWSHSSSGLPRARVTSLLHHNQSLYAGTHGGGVHQSPDGGGSWATINGGLSNLIVTSLADHAGGVYAGTLGGGVFRLDDKGSGWKPVNEGLSDLHVRSLAGNGTDLFAGTERSGVFRSSNQGESWTRVASGLPAFPVYAILVSGTSLFAGTAGGGVYRSLDNGGSWVAANTGLTNLIVRSLVSSKGSLFCGTAGGGVFRSTNNGASWTPVNVGITNLQVLTFLATPGALLAGTEAGGVFFTANSGASWELFNSGLPQMRVTSLVATPSTFYAGIDRGGVFVLK